MNRVETITSKLDTIFKQVSGLSSEEYERVIFNIEILKKRYFQSKFKHSKTNLYESKTFKEFIE